MTATPKERVRWISDAVRRIFFAGTREEAIAAHVALVTHAIQSIDFLLKRDLAWQKKYRALSHELEALKRARAGSGISRPTIPQPRSTSSSVEQFRRITNELRALEEQEIQSDAFEIDEEEWFETAYIGDDET